MGGRRNELGDTQKGNLGKGELGDTHKGRGTWGHSQSAQAIERNLGTLTKRIGHRTLLLLIDSDTSNLSPQATRH